MALPHKTYLIGVTIASTLLLFGCTSGGTEPAVTEPSPPAGSVTSTTQDHTTGTEPSSVTRKSTYMQIDQETAKKMIATDDNHVIIDVRRQDEYDAGHIPGAISIPNESIGTERPEELPDIKQIILVYCRSGRRSKEASQKLTDMGYENIYEFGGINDWTGEIVTDDKSN